MSWVKFISHGLVWCFQIAFRCCWLCGAVRSLFTWTLNPSLRLSLSFFSCTVQLDSDITSAQYCCLASESMCAKPPSTRAFIRDLCTELDSRCRGGLRLANCFARFHQLSHCTTMFALNRQRARGGVRYELMWRQALYKTICSGKWCPESLQNKE